MSYTSGFTSPLPENSHGQPFTIFEHICLTSGYLVRRNGQRQLKDGIDLDVLPYPIKVDVTFGSANRRIILTPPDAVIAVALQGREASLYIAAASKARVDALYKEVEALLPERPRLSEKEEVHVDFWSLTPQGSRALERTIGITPWNQVEANYSPATKTELEKLMVGFKPSKAGQLILWHGVPGTGKTHALRALAWSWRKWCSFHYITDPELFFGSNANYMLDVLLLRNGPSGFDDDDDVEIPKDQWRLLILEDSGELMVPDAKAQTGQGLSRLLNVVDGLIGQGLRILVLVTTNEILKKLHPAVARPGRCAARIEFGEFKRDDATQWLASRGVTDGPPMAALMPLAELYALLGDGQIVAESKTQNVGFLQ